jgi:hypothetical protein
MDEKVVAVTVTNSSEPRKDETKIVGRLPGPWRFQSEPWGKRRGSS